MLSKSVSVLCAATVLAAGAATAATAAPAQPTQATTATATGRTLNPAGTALYVRQQPGTTATILTKFTGPTTTTLQCQTPGQKVKTTNIWYRVTKDGKTGYISAAYVTPLTGKAPTCTTPAPKPAPPASKKQCSTAGTGNKVSCEQAVRNVRARLTTTPHAAYVAKCDKLAAMAYGFSASGSYTASQHWAQVPSNLKHPGDRDVPAGALAFYTWHSAGHVMVSLGGGQFATNDKDGRYVTMTIDKYLSRNPSSRYLGWTQPWFKVNH